MEGGNFCSSLVSNDRHPAEIFASLAWLINKENLFLQPKPLHYQSSNYSCLKILWRLRNQQQLGSRACVNYFPESLSYA